MSRMMQTNHYETECTLKCTDNGKIIVAEVDRFKEKESLSVVIQGSAVVNLRYNSKFDEYVGSKTGLEFISKGPKFIGSSYRR